MCVADIDSAAGAREFRPLGQARRGYRGRIEKIHANGDTPGLAAAELERRLVELGFVEGARVEILHEGTFGRDPIAVRVDNATIALRRSEAMAVLVTSADEAP
jgi:ferrous iron transport protein A